MARPVHLIRSSSLAEVDYAYAATAPAGSRVVLLAGSCPLDAAGRTVGVGDHEVQARCVVDDNLIQALSDAGATLDHVLYTRILVASHHRHDLVLVWDVVRKAFGDHDVPSTLLGVTVLGYPDQLVEVEAVAAVQD